ncbi:hypothetical protein UCD39_07685 [Nitrospirillum sp. BR 11752]|uniref:hypothetical protein n=1 Tax=Nitrospirillum sp. BR 11752 TaxID=3104293 RepID=UPI002EB23156|nr:hypothetical protein [Nitrospirillum sp. BR 11752]
MNALHKLLSVTVVLLLLVPLTDLAMQVLPPVVGALPPLLAGLVFVAFLGQAAAAVIRRAGPTGGRAETGPGSTRPGSLPKEIAP